jgi:hypothetical protein
LRTTSGGHIYVTLCFHRLISDCRYQQKFVLEESGDILLSEGKLTRLFAWRMYRGIIKNRRPSCQQFTVTV